MYSSKNEQSMKITMAELKFTNISKLLLLPDNYSIVNHENAVNQIFSRNYIFRELALLELKIQPILNNLENQGLIVSKGWFEKGVKEKVSKLNESALNINYYTGTSGTDVDQIALSEFWKKQGLPDAKTFEDLNNYKQIHPTFELMLLHRKYSNYLRQWSRNLKQEGSQLANHNVIIKGNWQSFSSYTGRMTARRLPLTSMPREMRRFIVEPEGGTTLISLDLSNAELRFLAYYAGCNGLLEQFQKGADIHSETAKLIQNQTRKLDLSDDIAREVAKRYTFSLLYGAGLQTMLKGLQKIHKDVAMSDLISINTAFSSRYSKIQEFLSERENSTNLLTPYGAVEPIARFNKSQKRNFSLQSSVSIAIKILMLVLAKHKICIAHIVHDEVWIKLPEQTDVDKILKKIIKEFERELNKVFDGFPVEGLVKKEKITKPIGGNYND